MELSWFRKGTIYQIYPRSFYDSNDDGIGDLRGIIEKLDYIKSLHVDIIWISPIFSSPNDDNGYDISDYRNIMDVFGTMDDFDELLREAHQRDLRIVLDIVANHCSDEHQWFVNAKKSKDNPFRGYFHWKAPAVDGGPPNNWESFFGGSAWELDSDSGMYYLHLFTKKQPDLNWENPKVREEMHSIMKFWLDKGIDGFRMDVLPLISKRDGYPDNVENGFRNVIEKTYAHGPRVHEYLKEMNAEVMSKYNAFTLAEGIGVNSENAGLYVNEDRNELDMLYHFDVLECTIVNGKFEEKKPFELVNLKRIFKKWRDAMGTKGWIANALGNHDFARMVTRFGNDTTYHKESAKLLLILQATQNGTLCLYQGDEIGMTNISFDSIHDVQDIQSLNFYHQSIASGTLSEANALSVINAEGRDNARTPMQWDHTQYAGFSSQKEPWIKVNPNYESINVAQQDQDSNSILNFYRNLIKVRKQQDVFIFGEFDELYFDHPSLYAYTKSFESQHILVILNFSITNKDFKIPKHIKINKELINNYKKEAINTETLILKPYQGLIFSIDMQ